MSSISGVRVRRAITVGLATGAMIATGAVVAAPAQALTVPTVTAKGAFVMNGATGATLYTKSGDTKRLTASTTKIMTAKVVLSQPNLNLDTKVTIRREVSDYMVAEGYPSTARLIVGDKVTVRQLLYGMMLPSGCDAAMALADKFGTGTTVKARTANFIGKMNTMAKSLGMTNTHFDSFDGLSNGSNYSTPRDLTKLARSTMKSSTFRAVVKTKSYTAKTITASGSVRTMATWYNTNTLLGWNGTLGIKTGSGPEAKYCLVFAATLNGEQVMGTVLSSSSEAYRTSDVKKLINYGYARIS
ncbi:D-alanyl-D-alanine carboxypeptidase family protein [Streptomyces sp.]|uniref:D-alanyl-D-alanine carboxypeptidase family protein n=1 Tax=Streptomyces sp. TaxID=1931 RepID=UPI002D416684|nr:serine hydrolase [Streptomyces sp.]HZF87955.1 serine hydrolase [Streptomyces sp.]